MLFIIRLLKNKAIQLKGPINKIDLGWLLTAEQNTTKAVFFYMMQW